MEKLYIYGIIAGNPEVAGAPDTMFSVHIQSYEFRNEGIEVVAYTDRPEGARIFLTFGPGHRYYLVSNTGQCQEPNGEIIWRNEDGKDPEKG